MPQLYLSAKGDNARKHGRRGGSLRRLLFSFISQPTLLQRGFSFAQKGRHGCVRRVVLPQLELHVVVESTAPRRRWESWGVGTVMVPLNDLRCQALDRVLALIDVVIQPFNAAEVRSLVVPTLS